MADNARDEPNFVSVFGAENEEFDYFWSASFSDENVFHCFRIFFVFSQKRIRFQMKMCVLTVCSQSASDHQSASNGARL